MGEREGEARGWAETLAAVTVLDLEDRVIPLGSLWRDRPTLLVFLRHYG